MAASPALDPVSLEPLATDPVSRETPERPRRLLLGGLLGVRDPAPGEPRRDRWLELGLFLAILLLAALTPARTADGIANAPGMQTLERLTGGGICIYRRVTGVECGGCGLTRAFVQLAHGHPQEALRLNPVAPLLFAWCAWRLVELIALVGAGRDLHLAIAQGWKWAFYGCVIGGLATLAVVRLAVHLLS